MARPILIKDDSLIRKISAIGTLFFGTLSGAEIEVLAELIKMSDGSGINVSADTGKSIRNTLNLNGNTFNVCLSRLNKKKAIKKDKTIITLHPILNNLFNENEFIIRFEKPEN